VITSGVILKKTKAFAGEAAPFVMELPSYHMPLIGNVLRTTWERGWSFVKRAGSVILLASIAIWILMSLSFDGGFHYITEESGGNSVLEYIGGIIAYIFVPLGFGNWQSAVATILGFMAKEEVAGALASIAGSNPIGEYIFNGSALAGMSFLIFNLLCAPCFAAMGAIRREMNNAKWTWFTIGYMCVFAYTISLIVYNIGMLFCGVFSVWTVFAFVALAVLLYFLFRKNKYESKEIKR
ncbi:MAG: ferrous iron transporter B, partial [Ruminococcus sp.]|nr:ferrous iron transporter B [Ruminococcus sp.]